MQNIEIKVGVDSFAAILKKLKKIGAKYQGALKQMDTYYKSRAGRLKIREVNNKFCELIFYKRPNITEQKISKYEVVKLPKESTDGLRNILKVVLEEKIKIDKVRNLWVYKNTRIHLDCVEKLGNFLELETLVKGDINRAKKEYKEIVDILGLQKYKKYKKSYSDML